MDAPPGKRAQPKQGRPTTYRGLYDMAEWWAWSEEFEANAIPAYKPFIKAGDLCFDIGANRGRKTWIMRQLGARVVAVDPLFAFADGREFVPEFAWRWGKDRMVKTVARAVAPGRSVTLAINRFMPYVSSMDRAWMTESSHGTSHPEQPYYRETSLVERTVATITLDGLINIYGVPAFMKVDVEGAENVVFSTLSTPVPACNMEFHRDWIPDGAMRHLERLGRYEWTYALGNAGTFEIPWATRDSLLTKMRQRLTDEGPGSWGDIYGRLVE